jgi:hypothetical protein
LDSLILLQESVPEVVGFLGENGSQDAIAPSAAARLNTFEYSTSQTDRTRLECRSSRCSVGLCQACVRHDELLTSVVQRFQSRNKLRRLKDFGLSALSWSYQVLDSEDEFTDFRKLLKSETGKRGLSEADVESSKLGYLKWNRAKT